jgi:hypothetical protein
MEHSIIIVDNFYDDPFSMRDRALSAEYHLPKHSESYPNGTGLWPGCVSRDRVFPFNLDKTITDILGKPVRSDRVRGGYFRISNSNDIVDQFCHTDSDPLISGKRQYQAVIYLNPPEQSISKTGTNFYKHKKTNTNRILSISDNGFIQHDFYNPTVWSLDCSVSLVWNRMVLFDSSIFHSYGELFGTELSNSRCTHIFSFHEI